MDNPLSDIFENAAQRIVAIVGELMVQSVAAVATTQQVEQIARLEQSAQQLEAEGKTEIAAVLRARVAQLSTLVPLVGPAAVGSGSWTNAMDGIVGNQLHTAAASDMIERSAARRRRRPARHQTTLATLDLDIPSNVPPTVTEKPLP